MGHEDLATTQRYMHAAQSIVSTTHFRSHLDDIIPNTSENSVQNLIPRKKWQIREKGYVNCKGTEPETA